MDRRFDGTFFAAFTDIGVHLGDFLADDADIVQVWLDTVVWAAAYCNLKFVGKGNIPVAFVEALVDFLGNGVGIQKSVLAGGSLAGYYRTDLAPVPPVTRPSLAINCWNSSILS